MLVAPAQAPHTPRPATYGRHAAVARRRRHVGDRLVARSRGHTVHTDVPSRRSHAQRARLGSHAPDVRLTRSLPCPGPAPGVPRGPVIMPTAARPTPLRPVPAAPHA